jgi:hypothetical protein
MRFVASGTIIPPTGTNATAAALVQVIWNALTASKMTAPTPWPYAPDSLDWTSLGNLTVAIDGTAGTCKFTFSNKGGPTFSGTLNLALLEAQLVAAPNYVTNDSGTLGPSSSFLRWDSPPITRQKGGTVFVTGEWEGTQSAQDIVTVTSYRELGGPG